MAKALGTRHLRFVARFIATGNGTQSYLDAFGPRCACASARSGAARLLADPRVKELLAPTQQAAEVARAEEIHGLQISRDRIRLELARLSFFDPRKLFAADGRLKPVAELDADTAAAVSQFDVEETTDEDGTTVRVTRVKFWDKVRALTNLADTEAGTWADGSKATAGSTSVNVNVKVGPTFSLTAEDLAAVDELLGRAGFDEEARAEARSLNAGTGGVGPPMLAPGGGEGGI